MDRGSFELVAVAWKQLMGGAAVRTPRQFEKAGSTAAGRVLQATGGLRHKDTVIPLCVVKLPSHKFGFAKS